MPKAYTWLLVSSRLGYIYAIFGEVLCCVSISRSPHSETPLNSKNIGDWLKPCCA